MMPTAGFIKKPDRLRSEFEPDRVEVQLDVGIHFIWSRVRKGSCLTAGSRCSAPAEEQPIQTMDDLFKHSLVLIVGWHAHFIRHPQAAMVQQVGTHAWSSADNRYPQRS